jgi:solute carrier family 25 carnitine/acylcarnitine transporter 20/29
MLDIFLRAIDLTAGCCSMLGSLTLYRRLLLENVFSNPHIRDALPFSKGPKDLNTLPSFGHGIAGTMAGSTVSFIAAPVEHVKARLQIQYAADKKQRMYSGPIDCTKKIVSRFLACNF